MHPSVVQNINGPFSGVGYLPRQVVAQAATLARWEGPELETPWRTKADRGWD